VWTGQGFGDCGFDFELGHRYFVYAYRDTETGRDETGSCSRTREFSEASEDIAFLRGASEGTVQTRIFGIVTAELDEFRTRALWWTDGPAKFPVPAVRLSVESQDVARHTVTDASGQFGFGDLPAGRYVVTGEAAGFRFNGLPRTVDLRRGSCSAFVVLANRASAPH
jgi:hypothetical protein